MLVKRFYQDGTMDIIDIYIGKDRDRHLLKTMRTILHALSYGNIEVESSRRLVDLKKLDAMRIFLRKLDVKVYNGDYEVPVRLYFPTEEAMQRNLQEPLDFPVLVFFHGGGWVTESVDTYNRVCARMAQSTGQIVMSVEYRLAPEYRFPTAFDDCYAAAKELYTTDHLLKTMPENITVIGDSAGGNLAAAVCLKARDTGFQYGVAAVQQLYLSSVCGATRFAEEGRAAESGL